MNRLSTLDFHGEDDVPDILWEDGERRFCRVRRDGMDGVRHQNIAVLPAPGHSTPAIIRRLTHEYALRDYLDGAWSLRPVELVRELGHTMLFVEYTSGEPLDRLIQEPMEIGQFLRIATALSVALGRLHGSGLVHKDIKPANVIIDPATDKVWFTGFGVASRLARERQAPAPPEFIAGTLAYMAPEQTGRVNRSIDSRSDLYSIGITFYEMLTGRLPFTATDPMEWVHCHIARQPVVPSERLGNLPTAVSAIIMKLLSKTVEERYQTAAGVEADLRRCLFEWESNGKIQDFALGQLDVPDRLMIPEKLYGRDRELDTLLAAFDRIVAGGRPELVLVSGYSGIGKSAVVNELHKPLVPPRGLFAAGKFDQYKRDIPYATLAQAFQSLIRPLLNKREEDLCKWRDALREALDPNGLLIVELVPELKYIIGEQPPVPEIPPREAQGRFQLVFRRFISVFARPEHPLALFLDDLQWLDSATLDLLEDLLTRTDLQHLLLIGAYRDNEVNSTHPLVRKIQAIRHAGAAVQDIVLTPLGCSDMSQLLADSLHCEPESAAPLAQLILDKTAGNPFFAIQFISTMADEGLLMFEYGEGRWRWELNRIHAKRFTDNVVDLMVGKLSRLPTETQRALRQFACMGNSAEFEMLRIVYQESLEDMHEHLWEAVRLGLIFRSEESYRFLHDRVQEAAYSMIPKELRAEAHLRIGMLLAAHTPSAKRDETIFEIVNQLNRGSHLITAIDERERVAGLNLIAGRRAKNSTAYASALKYLRAGSALLSETTWTREYELIFAIEYLMAECELLTAEMVNAEKRLLSLVQRAKTRHDICVVTRLRLTLYTALDQSDRGVDVFLDWLRQQGTVWSKHPRPEDAIREYERVWTLLGDRQIEELVDLPLLVDPDVLDTMDVFTEIVTPSLLFDEHLSSLVVCRLVTLSLEHGNCHASCFAYVWLAMFAGPRFNNYKGLRFGQVGCDLVDRPGLGRYRARTYMSMGSNVVPWVKHAASGRQLLRLAFDAAYKIGDLTFAAYSWCQLVTNCLAVGDPLAEVQTEAENGLAFARSTKFGLVIDISGAQVGLIRTLRGLNSAFGVLSDADFDEIQSERNCASNQVLALSGFFYFVRKLQGRFFAGDHMAAVDASLMASQHLWTSPSHFESAEFRFYGALAHAACWTSASTDQKLAHYAALTAHFKHLEVWANNCPETFENRAALVAAEIARIEGRALDAEHLYEKAVRSANAQGFVHNEALANELAAVFYAARGFERIATTYMRDARNGYLRWGADGKVRQIDQLYPHLRVEKTIPDPTSTMITPVEHLDLATVIKVSEAISGEIVLERLIDTLMRTAIEQAGAERGLLILPRGDDYLIEAEVTTTASQVKVELRQTKLSASDLPESVFRYAIRTKECVLLHDASGQGSFSSDEYIRARRSRSVLCMPILRQTQLLGMLFLENSLTPHAFTPARMAVLKLLASEAATSMESARLYRELAEREGRIRRMVDANIIGIVIWDFDGRILEANDAYLQMLGYEREDLLSGRLRWKDLTPPEWLEAEERDLLPQLRVKGKLAPFEKEYFRKDGSRIPVLLGLAVLENHGNQGVAFALDLTELKRAELELRRAHDDLADAQRLSKTGSFTTDLLMDQHTWSEEAYRIFEFPPSTQITVQMVRDTIHPDDLSLFDAAVARGLSVREVNFAFRILTARGAVKHVRGVARVHQQSEKRPKFSGAIQDVTESIVAEEALSKARSELARVSRVTTLGALTASIAHEVNQPLSGIITNASTCLRMLDAKPPNIDGALETARRTIRDGKRAAEVLTRLRSLFSKSDFTPESLDLNEAIREVIALSSGDLQRNRVIIQSDLANDLPAVTGDRVQLQQVILNLVRNASDAMLGIDSRPRKLLIRTERDGGDSVRVTVRDDGIGIDGHIMEKLFDTFYTTKNGGMGIGLSVSRSIIEHHRGRLWAEANDGPGATFAFSIPVESNA